MGSNQELVAEEEQTQRSSSCQRERSSLVDVLESKLVGGAILMVDE